MPDKPIRPSDTKEGKIIRGASVGTGIFLSWLLYTKKAEPQPPPPPGCSKGCVLIIIGFILLAIVSSLLGY